MRVPAWLAVALAAAVAACKADPNQGVELGRTVELASVGALTPAAVPMEQASLHFQNGDYGLAERYFRQATEQDPNNTRAWLGLAASYDHLRRFDLAERAYGVVVKQAGYTTEVHNNLGYHHYLRGNYAEARKHFMAAKAHEPDNPHIKNNIKLLEASAGR